jgi:hypothetical protein
MNKKEKRYSIEVTLKFTNVTIAKDKTDAVEKIKADFFNQYDIELDDTEIGKVKEF